jgi:tetratricopeptide (TPR) repeat protein
MSSSDCRHETGGEYRFWTPPHGRCVRIGPEQLPVPLPAVPLPVHREDLAGGAPADDAIGRGLYDFLRQYPDCPDNLVYAGLLRDAFPHYLADLGAQTAMLDHKEVDPLYVRRKVAGLKILALLEPENPGLLRQIGLAYYDLALTFTELPDSRSHLLAAIGFLQRALAASPGNLAVLNELAQVDYFLGDYPAAARRWQEVVQRLAPGPARDALEARLERIERLEVPDHPLVDDLEAIGFAMQAYAEGDYREARNILERLEEEGTVTAELPTPEFFYLLGMSRGKDGDPGGAFAAFDQALAIAPDYLPALEGRDLVLEGKEF